MEATSDIFPVFSQLHEDAAVSPGESPKPRIVPFVQGAKRAKRTHKRQAGRVEYRGLKADGHFSYQSNSITDTQKAILAVAYLLDWSSEIGNSDVSGGTAAGLSSVLRLCAKDVGRLFTIVDLRAAGGDPRKLDEVEQ